MTPLTEFHALYEYQEEGLYWRSFFADDFDHALEQARDATEEGERLVSLLRVR